MLLRLLAEDVHRPDDAAGAVFDRCNVHERDNARAVRSLDHDLLVAQSLAGCEHVGHGTFRMGIELPSRP